jgi:hypothetical protein
MNAPPSRKVTVPVGPDDGVVVDVNVIFVPDAGVVLEAPNAVLVPVEPPVAVTVTDEEELDAYVLSPPYVAT